MMLQQDSPEDFVIATGETRSVREFLDAAFGRVGLDPAEHVEIDARYFRPAEVDYLHGDASRARERLGWKPEVSFDQLVDMMVDADLKLAAREKMLRDAGHVEPGGEPHDP